MEDIFLKIAGFTIGIKFNSTEWPFITEREFSNRILLQYFPFVLPPQEHIDFWVEVAYQNEFDVLVYTDKKKTYLGFYEELGRKIVTYYHISEDQFQLVLRRILQHLLATHNGFILHASSVLLKDKICIFLGESGAGKSTAVWQTAHSLRPFSDDMLIIRKIQGIFKVYQTPFREKNLAVIKTKFAHDLGAFLFLVKSKRYQLSLVSNKESILKLLPIQLLTEHENQESQLKLLLELVSQFDRFFTLRFSLKDPQKLVKLLEKSYE